MPFLDLSWWKTRDCRQGCPEIPACEGLDGDLVYGFFVKFMKIHAKTNTTILLRTETKLLENGELDFRIKFRFRRSSK